MVRNTPSKTKSYNMYFVYIVKCGDGTLYCGITNDIARRLEQHKNGSGAHYTHVRGVRKMLYSEKQPTRSAALKREAEIKKWPRRKKLHLVHSRN